jgi:HPt (histidine-containing phosphotransfer) domain-containing protein
MRIIDLAIYESMARVLQASGQLEQLTESFCANNAARIRDLKNALANKDYAQVSAIGHALKGSCSMFGARSCAELCQRLEHIPTQPKNSINDTQLSELIVLLECEILEVTNFLRAQAEKRSSDCCSEP